MMGGFCWVLAWRSFFQSLVLLFSNDCFWLLGGFFKSAMYREGRCTVCFLGTNELTKEYLHDQGLEERVKDLSLRICPLSLAEVKGNILLSLGKSVSLSSPHDSPYLDYCAMTPPLSSNLKLQATVHVLHHLY